MYKVELTEGEIRAIISDYDNAKHCLDEVVIIYDNQRENVLTESVDEAKFHIAARVNYLMTKLDKGC